MRIKSDSFRQILNVIAAPLMWILSTLPQVVDIGRTAKEFSDINDSLLVPYGIAFTIWFPIFIGCLGYVFIQAKPVNQTREIFRNIGGWTAGGFIAVCAWSLISSFAPTGLLLWGTALVFIPNRLLPRQSYVDFNSSERRLEPRRKILGLGADKLDCGLGLYRVFP